MSEAIENIIQAVQGLGREKVVEVIAGTDNRQMAFLPRDYQTCDVTKLFEQKVRYPVAVDSLDSLVVWIKQARAWLLEHQHEADEAKSLTSWLFWKEDSISVVPDVFPMPAIGSVSYDFKRTPEARLWGYPGLGLKADQKGFKKLVETTIALGEDVIKLEKAPEWLTVASNLIIDQSVKFVSVDSDDRNYAVAMESTEGKKSTKVPKELVVEFKPLVGFDEKINVKFRVDLRTKAEEAKATFELQCLNAEQVVRDVVAKAVDHVAKEAEEEPHTLIVINGGLGG